MEILPVDVNEWMDGWTDSWTDLVWPWRGSWRGWVWGVWRENTCVRVVRRVGWLLGRLVAGSVSWWFRSLSAVVLSFSSLCLGRIRSVAGFIVDIWYNFGRK
jgi:hypothetical protein